MKEQWRQYHGSIKALWGLLEVSDHGRLKKQGTNTYKNMNQILKCTQTAFGYLRMHTSINGQEFNLPVHRIVAETWCPNPDNKPYIDHINAVRNDNRASNLRWVTTQENCQNPIYVKKLRKRKQRELLKHDWMAEVNKKKCYIENRKGERIYFEQLSDINRYFHTNANLNRIKSNGDFVKTRKSKLYGWKIGLVN